MTDVLSADPRTGAVVERVAQDSDPGEVDRLCRDAQAAAPALEGLGRDGRAQLLRACAGALETRRRDIVRLADRETALGETRLNGELSRTCFQLALFADVLDDGAYLEATIDHSGDTPAGPRPDLRRMLVPVGPVAVFAASNFPLAFSVPGGDTASALAAGCPVLVKAHGSHAATSRLISEVLGEAVAAAGAPDGTIALVHGVEAGVSLVAHQAVRAVGFTGSLAGARALLSVIEQRPDPIPFYGELGSLNPVVVTPAAAAARADEIGRGLAQSFTLGAGQFCTKPGLVFVPHGADGDRLLTEVAALVRQMPAQWLLNDRIAASYAAGVEELTRQQGVSVIATGGPERGRGYEAVPYLLTAQARSLPPSVTEECFGPVTVAVRYEGAEDLLQALEAVPGSLTTTVHTGPEESELPDRVVAAVRSRSGRLVFNGFPTGVAVAWGQHHGGPWPATNSVHTSVGATAIRRFLRPLAWQDAPESMLPAELREAGPEIPRRIDGRLVVPNANRRA